MRFKPRAGIHGSDALGAAILSEHSCILFSQNIQTVPVLSLIKILVCGYLQAQPLELGLCNWDSDW